MLCTLSNLKDQDVQEIKTLESELGITALAFSCHDLEPSMMDKGALEKLQALESKLGLSLVAVKS